MFGAGGAVGMGPERAIHGLGVVAAARTMPQVGPRTLLPV